MKYSTGAYKSKYDIRTFAFVPTRKNEAYRLKKLREKITKHGESGGSVEYETWSNMKRRCYDKKNQDYQYYGGRGIKVCDEWKNDFATFLKDIGRRPKKTMTLDRIDGSKDYSPSNTRWADKVTQARNRRGWQSKKHAGNFRGISWRKDVKKWYARIGLGYRNLNLGAFSYKKDAIEARLLAEQKYWNHGK